MKSNLTNAIAATILYAAIFLFPFHSALADTIQLNPSDTLRDCL